MKVGNGEGLSIYHVGHSTYTNGARNFQLNDILHVPFIPKNLLSVQRITQDNNIFFEFHPHHFFVRDRHSENILLHRQQQGTLSLLQNLQPSIKWLF